VEAALDDRHHPGKGADDHDRRHGMVDVAGVQEGEGPGVSARMFGRSGFWPTTLVNMGRQRGMRASPSWPRARSAIRAEAKLHTVRCLEPGAI
jgi:hypothetical protein